jgi:MFS transporter, ACS family, D-galactonate transporter
MSVKYRVLGLLWLMQLVNYLDRINISIAAPTMMKDLHISPGSFGFVLAAFTLGYAIMQIPGGALGDRFGSKAVLIGSTLAWSFFTGLTGLVESLGALIIVRVLFGISEGASNGPSFKLVGDYFTSRERASANGLYLTSLALGPAFVAPIAAWLLQLVGWQGMFFLFVIPAVLMGLLIYVAMPRQRPGEVIHTEIRTATGAPSGLGDVMRMPTSWLLFFAYMAFNVAFWGYLGWMPSYLSIARHIDLKHLGVAASVPYVFGFLGLLVFGGLGSRIFYRHRARLVAAGYVLAGIALYASYSAATPMGSIAGLSAAAFFLYGGFGPVWGIALDLTPDRARGAFSGFVNCGGQIGGIFAPIVVGIIVSRTGSFTGGFLFMIAGLAISALCFSVLHPILHRASVAAPVRA